MSAYYVYEHIRASAVVREQWKYEQFVMDVIRTRRNASLLCHPDREHTAHYIYELEHIPCCRCWFFSSRRQSVLNQQYIMALNTQHTTDMVPMPTSPSSSPSSCLMLLRSHSSISYHKCTQRICLYPTNHLHTLVASVTLQKTLTTPANTYYK